MKHLQKAGIKQAVKIGLASKELTMEELARATGRDVSTLSSMLSRGTPSMKSILSITDTLNAKLIIRYDNGQEIQLEIK